MSYMFVFTLVDTLVLDRLDSSLWKGNWFKREKITVTVTAMYLKHYWETPCIDPRYILYIDNAIHTRVL